MPWWKLLRLYDGLNQSPSKRIIIVNYETRSIMFK
jgi:hypothetical protein